MPATRVRDYLLISLGCVLQALAMDLFLVPAQLAAGGVSGLAQIVNAFTGWPIGVMVALMNLPLFWVGWRYLGGRRFMARTVFTVVMYSVLMDVLALYLLWFRKIDSEFSESLAGVLGAIVYVSFFLSALPIGLYGGALSDHEGGIGQTIIGLDLNLFTFGLASTVLCVGWGLCKWARI